MTAAVGGSTVPRLLCVAHDFPYPADDGSSVRVLGMLELLASFGPVRLVVRPRPTTTDEHLATVRGFGVQLVLGPVQTAPRWRGPGLWLRSVLARTPPWYLLSFHRRVLELAEGHLDWCTHVVALDDFAGQYLRRLPRSPARVVLDKHKVYAVPGLGREARRDRAARVRQVLLAPIVRRNEHATLDRADAVIVTTAEEATRLRAAHGRVPDAVITTALPVESSEPCADLSSAQPPGRRVLWLGNLDHGPNREGLRRLLDHVRTLPDSGGFELVVVGRGSPGGLAGAAEGLAVRFEGYVEQLAVVAGTSRAAVVPLWSGGGIKVKTLVLMAHGLAVAATPEAMEGTGAVPGEHCVVGRTEEELVDGLRRLLDDPATASAMGRRARALVVERHGWASRREPLRDVLDLPHTGRPAFDPPAHGAPQCRERRT